MEAKTVNVGLYSKLNINVCSYSKKNDKEIFKLLTSEKYTFSKFPSPIKNQPINFFMYSIKVDSIDDAYFLKKKIEAISKEIVFKNFESNEVMNKKLKTSIKHYFTGLLSFKPDDEWCGYVADLIIKFSYQRMEHFVKYKK